MTFRSNLVAPRPERTFRSASPLRVSLLSGGLSGRGLLLGMLPPCSNHRWLFRLIKSKLHSLPLLRRRLTVLWMQNARQPVSGTGQRQTPAACGGLGTRRGPPPSCGGLLSATLASTTNRARSPRALTAAQGLLTNPPARPVANLSSEGVIAQALSVTTMSTVAGRRSPRGALGMALPSAWVLDP